MKIKTEHSKLGVFTIEVTFDFYKREYKAVVIDKQCPDLWSHHDFGYGPTMEHAIDDLVSDIANRYGA